MISVIVPIYKVEQLLERCIESVLSQDYENFELILVDDGSPDRCGTICDKYFEKDNRIKVIHKENGGLSDARNAGLAIAEGEYIAFIDSDDWVAPDYLSCMLDLMNSTEADICECEILRTSSDEKMALESSLYSECFDVENALRELICDGVFHQYVWNKLYKRECIGDNLFPVGKLNEDEFWTYRVFGNADKIVKTDKVLYYYFQREGSIMGTKYNLRRLDALEAKKERQDYICCHYPELKEIAKVNLFGSCIYSGQMSLKYLQKEEKRCAIDKIDMIRKYSRPTNKELKSLSAGNRIWMQLASWNFWLTCKVKNLLGRGF